MFGSNGNDEKFEKKCKISMKIIDDRAIGLREGCCLRKFRRGNFDFSISEGSGALKIDLIAHVRAYDENIANAQKTHRILRQIKVSCD